MPLNSEFRGRRRLRQGPYNFDLDTHQTGLFMQYTSDFWRQNFFSLGRQTALSLVLAGTVIISGGVAIGQTKSSDKNAKAAKDEKGFTLIEEGTLVAAVSTQKSLYQKTISNMVEVKSRGAFVLAVTNEGNTEIEKASDYVIYIPETNQYFTNSLAIIPLQLFAYYVSIGKGCDVDKPRNLAKSVTVE